MDENWAAIIVSIVTGVLGFFGVVTTGIFALLRAKKETTANKERNGFIAHEYLAKSHAPETREIGLQVKELSLDLRHEIRLAKDAVLERVEQLDRQRRAEQSAYMRTIEGKDPRDPFNRR